MRRGTVCIAAYFVAIGMGVETGPSLGIFQKSLIPQHMRFLVNGLQQSLFQQAGNGPLTIKFWHKYIGCGWIVRKESTIDCRAFAVQRQGESECIDARESLFCQSIVNHPGRALGCLNEEHFGHWEQLETV
jgi:hypothetical protein